MGPQVMMGQIWRPAPYNYRHNLTSVGLLDQPGLIGPRAKSPSRFAQMRYITTSCSRKAKHPMLQAQMQSMAGVFFVHEVTSQIPSAARRAAFLIMDKRAGSRIRDSFHVWCFLHYLSPINLLTVCGECGVVYYHFLHPDPSLPSASRLVYNQVV